MSFIFFTVLVKINFNYYFLLFNTFKNCRFLWKYTKETQVALLSTILFHNVPINGKS